MSWQHWKNVSVVDMKASNSVSSQCIIYLKWEAEPYFVSPKCEWCYFQHKK